MVDWNLKRVSTVHTDEVRYKFRATLFLFNCQGKAIFREIKRSKMYKNTTENYDLDSGVISDFGAHWCCNLNKLPFQVKVWFP